MKTHSLEAQLWVPHPRDAVFPFFADASNLQRITPKFLDFKILTPQPIAMYPGALIDYRLSLHGIPIRWRTLISTWEPPFRFVDEQVRGPYSLWHHEHIFEERDGGTLVIDRVRYAIPFSWAPGSEIIHSLFVKKDIRSIFDFRQTCLREVFGCHADHPSIIRFDEPQMQPELPLHV